MDPTISAVYQWLHANEALAMWLEGVALILIFGLELSEYKRQGTERAEEHRESAEQMTVMKSQAAAAAANAESARLTAQAAINAQRPWIVIDIESTDDQSYRVIGRNKGRSPADIIDGYCGVGVYPVESFTVTDDKMGPLLAPLQPLIIADGWFNVITINRASHEIDNTELPPKMLYFFGRIRYWDTFTNRTPPTARPYETRWCVNWINLEREWVRTAIDYSRYT